MRKWLLLMVVFFHVKPAGQGEEQPAAEEGPEAPPAEAPPASAPPGPEGPADL